MSTSETESPCVAVCLVEGDICIGCYRSMDEIGEWLGATQERRAQIIDAAEVRRQDDQ